MQETVDPLSRTFGALADPTRREIIACLVRAPQTAGALAEPFGISRPAVSQHLRVLEDAGLITRTRQAQWRLCTLTPEPLDEATAWIRRHRRIWSARFDALADVLDEARPTPHDPATGGDAGPGSEPGAGPGTDPDPHREGDDR